jgi:acetyltransferase
MSVVPAVPSGEIVPPAFELVTRSGERLTVRQARPEDEALLAAFFDRVSAEERRFRFFCAQDHVGHDQIAPLVCTDHFRAESFLAFDSAGELVGHGLLACDNPLDTAEVAVSIRSDRRGQGIGWAMLDLLADAARQRGVRRVISIEDRDNHAAIALEREKGFTAQGIDGDPALVLLERLLR